MLHSVSLPNNDSSFFLLCSVPLLNNNDFSLPLFLRFSSFVLSRFRFLAWFHAMAIAPVKNKLFRYHENRSKKLNACSSRLCYKTSNYKTLNYKTPKIQNVKLQNADYKTSKVTKGRIKKRRITKRRMLQKVEKQKVESNKTLQKAEKGRKLRSSI